jgi:ATP-binding cassette, subfamily B, bacterial
MALLAGMAGVLPAVFAVLVGGLVGQLPVVVRTGFGSTSGHRTVAVLAGIGAVLLLTELVSGAQAIVSTDLYRQFDGYLLGRVMSAALSRDDLLLFDDPDLAASLDRGIQLARYGPGELVSGLSAQWTARCQGLSAAALVGYYWPVAAAVLTVLWLLTGRATQASSYRADPFWTDPLRRARYLQRIALLPHWAKEVRIFGLVGWLADQYGREWAQVMSQLWRARRADYRPMALLGGLVLGVHLVVLLLLASAASSGALSVAALVVILQGLFGMAMIASLEGDSWIENGSVPVPDMLSMERALHTGPQHTGPQHTGPQHTGPGRSEPHGTGLDATGLPRREISFRSVSFRYPGRDSLVLDGFDLSLAAGRSVAIVGVNGAGKTSLVKLLTGLCRPTAGTIEIDGISLADLSMPSWRRQIAVIFQDFVRYELSAADNIRLGAVDLPGTPDAVLADVADQAGAAGVITGLPAGLATTLSPRFTGGVGISGGQWQRIALARALMAVRAGGSVLVLDEPTAHLDIRAEAELYDRFLELTSGLTTIVISHRFSTVRRADRIVVLEHGRITEDGSHDELVAAGGRYARMFRLQASNYLSRPEDADDTD